MENTTNERVSIQIERPSLRVFSQADIDAGRTDERNGRDDRDDRDDHEPPAEEAQP
jgi:hypothetical protein